MFNPATEQIMKKRIFYIISFLVIFCMEVLIALYVRDRFIRPYVGDMLVVVLVYSFVRIFLPTGIPRMPFYVFLFACLVEVLQYFRLVETLGVTNRVARIVLMMPCRTSPGPATQTTLHLSSGAGRRTCGAAATSPAG